MHTIALLSVIIILIFFTYEGYHNGLYQATYMLANHLLGFLIALTFGEHLAELIVNTVPAFESHPGPEYLIVISVAVLFAATRAAGAYLRQQFIADEISALQLVDKIGGGVMGLADGLVISGFALILFSLMPFMAYIPGDYGRIKTNQLPIDTGAVMLKFYGMSSQKMSGKRPFLLEGEPILKDADRDGLPDGGPGTGFEDINGNGEWDRGWMWKYRHHADFTVEEVEQATGKEAPGE